MEFSFEPHIAENERRLVDLYRDQLRRKGVAVIFGYDDLAYSLGVQKTFLFAVSNSPRSFYRNFTIKKKSGGLRKISEPLTNLLLVQRWILKNILDKIPTHSACKAYKKDHSIKDHARFHRQQELVLQADIKDFFPNIIESRVFELFFGIGYTRKISFMLAKLCCLDGCLPQGAPTSGSISNLVLKSFDEELYTYCREHAYRYSRYADDIAVSSNDLNVAQVTGNIIRLLSKHGFSLNASKTRLMKREHRQIITGIVVNRRLNIPIETRKELRLHYYFVRKYGVFGHALRRGILDVRLFIERLIGMSAHAYFITKEKYFLDMRNFFVEERRKLYPDLD